MDDKTLVRLVMQEVGPRDDRILQVLRTGEDSWTVQFAQVEVRVEFDEPMRRLMLATDLAPVPERRREEIYQLLLIYSLLWRETGFLRMAIDDDDQAVQLVDLHCSSLTTEQLAIILHNLEERALLWREFIASGGEEALSSQAASASDCTVIHA